MHLASVLSSDEAVKISKTQERSAVSFAAVVLCFQALPVFFKQRRHLKSKANIFV